MKKFFAVLMCLIMVVVFMPTMAWAEGEENFSDEPMQLYAFKVGEGTAVVKDEETNQFIVTGDPLEYAQKPTGEKSVSFYFAYFDEGKYILLTMDFSQELFSEFITANTDASGAVYYTIACEEGSGGSFEKEYYDINGNQYQFAFYINIDLDNPENEIKIIDSQGNSISYLNVNVSEPDLSVYDFFITYDGATVDINNPPIVSISKDGINGWSNFAEDKTYFKIGAFIAGWGDQGAWPVSFTDGEEIHNHESLRVKFTSNNGEKEGILEIDKSIDITYDVNAVDTLIPTHDNIGRILTGAKSDDECFSSLVLPDLSEQPPENEWVTAKQNYLGALKDGAFDYAGGEVCLDIRLKEGYVVDSIVDENNSDAVLPYTATSSYYYDVTGADENASPENFGACVSSDGDSLYWVWQELAKGGDLTSVQGRFGADNTVIPLEFTAGTNNVDDFYSYCEEHHGTPVYKTAVTSYTIYLDPTKQQKIKIKTKSLDDQIDSARSSGDVTSSLSGFNAVPTTDGLAEKNTALQSFYDADKEIDKLYELTGNIDEGEKTEVVIPVTGNSEDYNVVWFDDNGNPIPMDVKYADGAIIMETGHFSKYALVKEKTDTPTIPGGSFGGGTTTDTVTNNPSDKTTTAEIKTTTETGSGAGSEAGTTTVKASVDQATGDKIVEKAVSNQSKEVVIDATAGQGASAANGQSAATAAEVGIPAAMLEAIAEKTSADVTVKTDVAEVTLDYQAVCAAAQQIAGDTVYLIVEKEKDTDEEVQFELKLVCSDGSTISDFGGGNAAVTVAVPKELAEKKLVCMYMDARGWISRVEGSKNADGTYTFTTKHFSTYVLMSEEDAVNTLDAQKEEIWNVKIALRSRQVKMKSGKKAVKLTWTSDSDIALDGVEVYRSTKRYSGYGKKPIFISADEAYYNTSVKAGTRYYYKVRGFVEVEGEKLYTDWSAKAWRKVK